MKFLKPAWVHHDEKPIFSVDVHQECEKFATGGQGLDSGRVVIWNLLPVLSEKAACDDSIPKILCQMDNHLSCVNCVRWSENGQMLASGSDDKLIMIWKKSKGPNSVFGTGGIQKNPESWKCAYTLRGHAGDVLDLAWAPQDRWLASCSIDNTIIVWDGHNLPTIMANLRGHTGLVKGVTWDPVGKYLASQSDDRSVKIWKTTDWTCDKSITEPFEECGGTTHILRLSWSPDGQYLVSAHAMNGGGPTAQIIEREGWKCDKDFVGHRKAVTCVRFHNSILKRQTAKSNKPQQYCCLAVGSRDRSLSVWMTALQRPLVVINELFNDSILDLSWGPEKCVLMACSGDGTVACLQFSEDELGTPLSQEEKNGLYQRIYGKSVLLSNGSNNTSDIVIENPELLNLSPDKIKPPSLPTITVTNHNNNFVPANPAPQPQATPLPVPVSVPTSNAAALFTSSNGIASTSPSSAIKASNKQLETRTADGKRRITPMFIPLNPELTDAPQPAGVAPVDYTKENMSDAAVPATIAAEPTAPAQNTMQTEQQTNEDELRLDSRLIKAPTATTSHPTNETDKNAVKTFPSIPTAAASKSQQQQQQQQQRRLPQGPKLSNGPIWSASTTGPKIQITTNTKCEFQKTALEYRVHVANGHTPTATGLLAKVTVYSLAKGGKLWDMFVGSPLVNLNFNRKYVMLCSLDGTMRLLNLHSGVPVFPIISLTSGAIQCAYCPLGKLLGVITECGILRIWNIEQQRVVLATTCLEIFKLGQIATLTITEHGIPLILFTNGQSYSYSANLQSWLALNTRDPIMRHGLQTTMPKELTKNYEKYPLMTVQASTNSFAALGNVVDLNSNNWQASAKITFIENQIKLCEAINSPMELKHWYSMLAYQLALSGTEERMRLFLNELLDGVNGSAEKPEKQQYILSLAKSELFEDALSVIKTHLPWQRIYMEYKELYAFMCANPTNGHEMYNDTESDMKEQQNSNDHDDDDDDDCVVMDSEVCSNENKVVEKDIELEKEDIMKTVETARKNSTTSVSSGSPASSTTASPLPLVVEATRPAEQQSPRADGSPAALLATNTITTKELNNEEAPPPMSVAKEQDISADNDCFIVRSDGDNEGDAVADLKTAIALAPTAEMITEQMDTA